MELLAARDAVSVARDAAREEASCLDAILRETRNAAWTAERSFADASARAASSAALSDRVAAELKESQREASVRVSSLERELAAFQRRALEAEQRADSVARSECDKAAAMQSWLEEVHKARSEAEARIAALQQSLERAQQGTREAEARLRDLSQEGQRQLRALESERDAASAARAAAERRLEDAQRQAAESLAAATRSLPADSQTDEPRATPPPVVVLPAKRRPRDLASRSRTRDSCPRKGRVRPKWDSGATDLLVRSAHTSPSLPPRPADVPLDAVPSALLAAPAAKKGKRKKRRVVVAADAPPTKRKAKLLRLPSDVLASPAAVEVPPLPALTLGDAAEPPPLSSAMSLAPVPALANLSLPEPSPAAQAADEAPEPGNL